MAFRRATTLGMITAGLMASSVGYSGGGYIYVTDRADKKCPAHSPVSDPESRIYFLTSGETIGTLRNYFAGKPNPELMDAIVVNAGLKFCGPTERAAVRGFVLAEKDKENVPRKVLEVARNYSWIPQSKK